MPMTTTNANVQLNAHDLKIRQQLFPDSSVQTDEKMKILFEEYKLYVQTMEKLVERRQTSHNLFLTASSALITIAGFLLEKLKSPVNLSSGLAVIAVSIAGILICWTWRNLIIRYGLMNGAKFKIIHELEKKLPAALFLAEWIALGEGNDAKKYKSMAKVESSIPLIFSGCYLVLALCTLSLMVFK
jgi:hypothetical protein